MKYFTASLLLTFWLIVTILLVCTIIGLAVIAEEEWWIFPKKLLTVFEQ